MPDASFSVENRYRADRTSGVRKAQPPGFIDASRPYILVVLLATMLLSLWIGLCAV